MSTGWKFSVTLPSWTQATLEGDELVVFYRVEVRVVAPESGGASKCRSVLRRFSHFSRLYSRLKEELGAKKMAKMDLPSRRAFMGVNKRPDLIERRRRELEGWLWKLIGDPEVARSRMLNNFLELSDAARLVQRSHAPGLSVPAAASRNGGGASSYARSDGGSSPKGDGASDLASSEILATPTQGSEARPFRSQSGALSSAPEGHAPGGDSTMLDLPPILTGGERAHEAVGDAMGMGRRDGAGGAGSTHSPATSSSSQRGLPPTSQRPKASSEGGAGGGVVQLGMDRGGAAGTGLDDLGPMRLGMRMEQRATVKQQVQALRSRLDRTSNDLQDAIEVIKVEQETKRSLAGRVQELEAQLAVDPSDREAQLTSALEEERAGARELQQLLQEARTQQDESEERLAAAEQRLTDLQQEASEAASKLQQSQTDLEKLRQTSSEQQAAMQPLAAELDALRSRAQSAEERCAGLMSETQTARDQAAAAQEAATAAESKARTDMKVLAKEVKSLRKELEAERSKRAGAEKQLADATSLAASREASGKGQQQLLEELQARLSASRAELASSTQDLSGQVAELKQQLTSAEEQTKDAKQRLQETGHLLNTRTSDLEKSSKRCAELDARVAQLVILEQDGESSLAQLQDALTRGEAELRGVHQARQQERAKLGGELDTLRQEQDRLKSLVPMHQAETAKLRQELEAAQKLRARAEQEHKAAAQGKTQAQQSLQQLTQQLQDAVAKSARLEAQSVSSQAELGATETLLREAANLHARLTDTGSGNEALADLASAADLDAEVRSWALSELNSADERFAALVAEAQLMADDNAVSGASSSGSKKLQTAFARLLADNGELRQQLNRLIRGMLNRPATPASPPASAPASMPAASQPLDAPAQDLKPPPVATSLQPSVPTPASPLSQGQLPLTSSAPATQSQAPSNNAPVTSTAAASASASAILQSSAVPVSSKSQPSNPEHVESGSKALTLASHVQQTQPGQPPKNLLPIQPSSSAGQDAETAALALDHAAQGHRGSDAHTGVSDKVVGQSSMEKAAGESSPQRDAEGNAEGASHEQTSSSPENARSGSSALESHAAGARQPASSTTRDAEASSVQGRPTHEQVNAAAVGVHHRHEPPSSSNASQRVRTGSFEQSANGGVTSSLDATAQDAISGLPDLSTSGERQVVVSPSDPAEASGLSPSDVALEEEQQLAALSAELDESSSQPHVAGSSPEDQPSITVTLDRQPPKGIAVVAEDGPASATASAADKADAAQPMLDVQPAAVLEAAAEAASAGPSVLDAHPAAVLEAAAADAASVGSSNAALPSSGSQHQAAASDPMSLQDEASVLDEVRKISEVQGEEPSVASDRELQDMIRTVQQDATPSSASTAGVSHAEALSGSSHPQHSQQASSLSTEMPGSSASSSGPESFSAAPRAVSSSTARLQSPSAASSTSASQAPARPSSNLTDKDSPVVSHIDGNLQSTLVTSLASGNASPGSSREKEAPSASTMPAKGAGAHEAASQAAAPADASDSNRATSTERETTSNRHAASGSESATGAAHSSMASEGAELASGTLVSEPLPAAESISGNVTGGAQPLHFLVDTQGPEVASIATALPAGSPASLQEDASRTVLLGGPPANPPRSLLDADQAPVPSDGAALGLDGDDLLGDLSAEDLPAATEVPLPALSGATARPASSGSHTQANNDGTIAAPQAVSVPEPAAGTDSATMASAAQNGPASWFGKLVSGAQQAASRAQPDIAGNKQQPGGDVRHGNEAYVANGRPFSGSRGQPQPRPGGFQRRGSFRGRDPPHGGLVAQRAAQIQRHQQQQRHEQQQQQQQQPSSFFGGLSALNNIAQHAKDSFRSSREAGARAAPTSPRSQPASDQTALLNQPASTHQDSVMPPPAVSGP